MFHKNVNKYPQSSDNAIDRTDAPVLSLRAKERIKSVSVRIFRESEGNGVKGHRATKELLGWWMSLAVEMEQRCQTVESSSGLCSFLRTFLNLIEDERIWRIL